MKSFNTTGLCNPNKHYMVDIDDKLEKIISLIEANKYFVINRPRQYGKTTILAGVRKKLSDKYLVISISFEGADTESFFNTKNFCNLFIDLISDSLEYVDEEINKKFLEISDNIDSLIKLSRAITKFIKSINKEVILIIDEVDKSSDNQVFLNFLGMLRSKYLQREEGYGITFKSVILAGVYDIKNLKLKLRLDEEKKYNSPWNIAVPFNIDMSLSEVGIKGMLKEYKKDRNIAIDTKKVAKFISFYTSGYPFLVSRICQIIDEDLGAKWNEETILKSVKLLLKEKNTLFEDTIKNMENNKELREYIFDIVFNGVEKEFNIDNPIIDLGVTFGYFREKDGKVKIFNRLLEQRLYNYFITKLKIKNIAGYNIKSDFVEGNGLNIEKILLKFQQFMKEQYSSMDSKFIEREGRLIFLAFMKPIINGVGFDFKEVQISEEKRLDVVIVYNTNKYIIELKIWRGEKYHHKGLKQLANYLDINEQEKGYLLIFDFNKDKEYKKEDIIVNGKEIVEVFV
ncbi:MAG: AAA-like domain-containing protein [Clostridium sp.]|nr:AAA family ATPase [Clostridium sp.]